MEQQPRWVPKSYTVVAAVKPATKWMASVRKAADGGEMTKNVAEYRKVPFFAFDVDIFHTFKNNQGQTAAFALLCS